MKSCKNKHINKQTNKQKTQKILAYSGVPEKVAPPRQSAALDKDVKFFNVKEKVRRGITNGKGVMV